MNTVEIYFSDLVKEAQDEVLFAAEMKSADEGNFEIAPLAIIEFETEEERQEQLRRDEKNGLYPDRQGPSN